MITRKTIIDQHHGTRPDGTPYTQLFEVVTEYDLDETYPEEQAWVDDVHALRVALAQLRPERRAAAEEWLRNHVFLGRDDLQIYRRALEWASEVRS